MSLFAPEPPPSEEHFSPQPEWRAPPRGVFPAVVPVERTLAVTTSVALSLDAVSVYPTGVLLTVRALTEEPRSLDLFGHDPSSRAVGGRFRLGVVFADGRQCDDSFASNPEEAQINLQSMSGGGTIGSADKRWWLWPLPPSGPLIVALVWPAEGIEETRVELDVDPWLAAVERVRQPWG